MCPNQAQRYFHYLITWCYAVHSLISVSKSNWYLTWFVNTHRCTTFCSCHWYLTIAHCSHARPHHWGPIITNHPKCTFPILLSTAHLHYYQWTAYLHYYQSTAYLHYYQSTACLHYYQSTARLHYYQSTACLYYYQSTAHYYQSTAHLHFLALTYWWATFSTCVIRLSRSMMSPVTWHAVASWCITWRVLKACKINKCVHSHPGQSQCS